jgi:hypothetical protein
MLLLSLCYRLLRTLGRTTRMINIIEWLVMAAVAIALVVSAYGLASL